MFDSRFSARGLSLERVNVPEIATRDLPAMGQHRMGDPSLGHLDREAVVAWNPRLVRVRPNASRLAARLITVVAI